nr:immunoglobulin light chain junction region [Macaca mulatta]
CLQFNSEPLTF